MITILKSIGSAIVSVFNFLVHTVQTIFNFFSKIPQFISFLREMIDMLPDVFKTFALIGISAFVILFIIGRNK